MAHKKVNDDALLQLIRDGNSPAGAARPLGLVSTISFYRAGPSPMPLPIDSKPKSDLLKFVVYPNCMDVTEDLNS
ncbi:MAG: hypothetical protein ABSF90_23050 [Syntrophobacteraceae bacterium]|jgi:hypothetical protein